MEILSQHSNRLCPKFVPLTGIIFIGILHHINWNMLSYLLEYAVILIGICCHINRNMVSYLCNMASHRLDCAVIFIFNMTSY